MAVPSGMGAPAVLVRRLRGLRRSAPATGVIGRNEAQTSLFKQGRGGPVEVVAEWQETGQSCSILAPKGLPDERAMLLLAELHSAYVAAGCPESGWVPHFSWAQASRWMGYESTGGREAKRVADQLERLHTVAVRGRRHVPGAGWQVDMWHLLASVEMSSSGIDVRLSPETASSLRAGAGTFFDGTVLRRLVLNNPLAARLWLHFEADQGPERTAAPWRYRMVDLARLCLLVDSNHRRLRKKFADALGAIASADPRYDVVALKVPAKRAPIVAVHRVRTPTHAGNGVRPARAMGYAITGRGVRNRTGKRPYVRGTFEETFDAPRKAPTNTPMLPAGDVLSGSAFQTFRERAARHGYVEPGHERLAHPMEMPTADVAHAEAVKPEAASS
ncbi:MAG TPA: hypothetical protein VM427_06915 [Patescibacteria group bacterium]|nr:hypothetical protein [Patescibacteria group bacterium]